MNDKRKSRRTKLSKDQRTGRYCAKLGRKKTKGGRYDGHHFRFSTDERESERRKMKVQEFWDHLVENCGAKEWEDQTLDIAKALADGKPQVPIRLDQMAEVRGEVHFGHRYEYVLGLEKLRKLYPQVDFIPADAEVFQVGSEEVAQIGKELSDEGRLITRAATDHDSVAWDEEATVSEALPAFSEHIREKLQVIPDEEEGHNGKRLSDTGIGYVKMIERIRRKHGDQVDWPISRLTYEGCDKMLQVWRDRPMRFDEKGPMAVKTCRSHAKLLKYFFRWLSTRNRHPRSERAGRMAAALRLVRKGR